MELGLGLEMEQVDVHLMQGCCLEAERAETVWFRLEGLRKALPGSSDPHLVATIEEIRTSTRILRELADLSQVHQDRVPIVLDHLNIALPCISRSLRDITSHYEDRAMSKHNRWRKMYHQMAAEASGLRLPERFLVYNHYLSSLRDLLTRSPNFDLNRLAALRLRIMQLRDARGIPPPAQVGSPIRLDALASPILDPSTHWAEQIFSLPLPCRTELKNQHMSKSFGPHLPWGHLHMPAGSKILFRRPFSDDKVSLMVYQNGQDGCPYLLLRTFHMGAPWFSQRGAHELCIEREGSILQLKRWSRAESCPKLWATLSFITWEEMALFHCTFLALKAHNDRTVRLSPEEHNLRSERKLFQARILDDGFTHSLIVYEDRATNGLRLHAAVWDGELRQCPVWTAFVTHQSASTTWLKRVSRRRIRLADIHLYVFSQDYRQQSQRRGPAGAFEISFLQEVASQHFEELFDPRPAEITAGAEKSA